MIFKREKGEKEKRKRRERGEKKVRGNKEKTSKRKSCKRNGNKGKG